MESSHPNRRNIPAGIKKQEETRLKQLRRWISCFLIFCLAAGFAPPALGAGAVSEDTLTEAVSSLQARLIASARQSLPETEGLEWTLIGLARSDAGVPAELSEAYCAGLVSRLETSGGILDSAKYTEYSRVILALTAMGKEPSDVNGTNLLLPLGDFIAPWSGEEWSHLG